MGTKKLIKGNLIKSVIPAKAGIQYLQHQSDTGLPLSRG
jgi:hypothetical protein